MIPKVIHYCWFGRNPLPPLAIKCIESWKKYLPNYEIKEWNEDNFNVNIIPYTQEAYEAKKYAFVSDYARFWILYNYGGLYFDTDVEIIKPMDAIIEKGSFMGCENYDTTGLNLYQKLGVNPGLGMGSSPKNPFYKDMLNLYNSEHFKDKNGLLNLKNIVNRTTESFDKHGLKFTKEIQHIAGIWIYPKEYFNPMSLTGNLNINENTHSIHHFAASWLSPRHKIKENIKKNIATLLGEKVFNLLIKYKRYILS